MNPHLRRLIACLLACALLCPAALSDIRRGDSGNEVLHLQTLLFESGFLFELPDGQFGRNTEEA